MSSLIAITVALWNSLGEVLNFWKLKVFFFSFHSSVAILVGSLCEV